MTFHQLENGGNRRVVVKDPVSEKYFRLSDYDFRLLKMLDGRVTVPDAIEKLRNRGFFYELDAARIIVNKAARLGLLLGTKFGTAQYQKDLKTSLEQAKRDRRLSSVYFWFIPILNPDRFLERTVGLFKLLVNKWLGILVLLAAPGAVYLVVDGLWKFQHAYLFFFNWENLLYLWITIAFIKLIHEFSHAYVAKSFGLRVPQMGIAMLVFFPCLYCNTTDAWQLADRRQRLVIAAAGIIAEAVLAVVAAYVWRFTKEGMLNSLAFYLMAVSFISTLFFNANPLMKFDGYFILMDYLEMPNLVSKAYRHIRFLFLHKVLGLPNLEDPAKSKRERRILTVYGIASFIYRMFLYSGIIVGVYYRFDKMVGILLALLGISLFIIRPIFRGTRSLIAQRGAIRPKLVGSLVFLSIVAALVAVLVVPFSGYSVFPCYLGSRQVQKLTVPLLTRVENVFIHNGSVVQKNDVLFRLDTTYLELLLRQEELKKGIAEQELDALLVDPEQMAKAPAKRTELRQIEREIARIKKYLEVATSSNIAPFAGVITSLDYRLQPGFQPGEGVVVGELQSPTDCVIHALVPAAEIAKVRVGQEAEIWFPIGEGRIIKRKIDYIKSYSERDLENSPFSSRFGGELATEAKSEQQRDAPLEAQFDCAVYFRNSSEAIPLGTTGRLAVKAPPRSLIVRLWDRTVQAFNRESLL